MTRITVWYWDRCGFLMVILLWENCMDSIFESVVISWKTIISSHCEAHSVNHKDVHSSTFKENHIVFPSILMWFDVENSRKFPVCGHQSMELTREIPYKYLCHFRKLLGSAKWHDALDAFEIDAHVSLQLPAYLQGSQMEWIIDKLFVSGTAQLGVVSEPPHARPSKTVRLDASTRDYSYRIVSV